MELIFEDQAAEERHRGQASENVTGTSTRTDAVPPDLSRTGEGDRMCKRKVLVGLGLAQKDILHQ